MPRQWLVQRNRKGEQTSDVSELLQSLEYLMRVAIQLKDAARRVEVEGQHVDSFCDLLFTSEQWA
jgi:hypothetical protein